MALSEPSIFDDKEKLVTEDQKLSTEQRSSEEYISESTSHLVLPMENEHEVLQQKIFSPGNDDVCLAYINQSNSSIFLHPRYPYPAVEDPGIREALYEANSHNTLSDDGQELYLHVCSEMNVCPVRSFYKNLISSEINLSYYGVAQNGIRPMAKALQYNNFVTRLDLTDNFLNDDSCYHLGQMLRYNDTLQELILAGCRIGASGWLHLGDNLHFNCSLVTLQLERNNIGDAGGVIFANDMSTIFIKEVNLSKNGLGQITASSLSEALECRNPLTHLDLSWNDLSHIPSTVKMLKQLANSELMLELNLSFTSLKGENVAAAICNVLKMPELTILDLSYNLFQGEAINLIADDLINARKLKTLNLSNNPMSTDDAYIILHKILNPQVKLHNLLMDNVCVNKSFLNLLEKISVLEFRENFVVTYGEVLKNWTIIGPDPRVLLLKRAQYLSEHHKKHHIDIALYFMKLNKKYEKPVPLKELVVRLKSDKVSLGENFVNELADAFEGPRTQRTRTVNFQLINETIRRLWPNKVLLPTPPAESEPIPPPPPPKSKRKGGKRKF